MDVFFFANRSVARRIGGGQADVDAGTGRRFAHRGAVAGGIDAEEARNSHPTRIGRRRQENRNEMNHQRPGKRLWSITAGNKRETRSIIVPPPLIDSFQ